MKYNHEATIYVGCPKADKGAILGVSDAGVKTIAHFLYGCRVLPDNGMVLPSAVYTTARLSWVLVG
ncbi:hypothetical protein [Endozoicomonas sp. Mp262]|uniref:hypothetical protein n=1 Tax=Endozoicomonas sp. Mp262 TaxID=2919499 RepID=UPI0021D990AC